MGVSCQKTVDFGKFSSSRKLLFGLVCNFVEYYNRGQPYKGNIKKTKVSSIVGPLLKSVLGGKNVYKVCGSVLQYVDNRNTMVCPRWLCKTQLWVGECGCTYELMEGYLKCTMGTMVPFKFAIQSRLHLAHAQKCND